MDLHLPESRLSFLGSVCLLQGHENTAPREESRRRFHFHRSGQLVVSKSHRPSVRPSGSGLCRTVTLASDRGTGPLLGRLRSATDGRAGQRGGRGASGRLTPLRLGGAADGPRPAGSAPIASPGRGRAARHGQGHPPGASPARRQTHAPARLHPRAAVSRAAITTDYAGK